MKKILTVAIPAYNVEDYLAECLDSLLAAEAKEKTEILIIDDGSTDSTGRIANQYEQQYPNIIRVIHKENGGHGSAVNRGIREAAGIYFKVVDSDDYVDSKTYDNYLKKLENIDCDLIATPFTCVRYRKTPNTKQAVVLSDVIKTEKRQVEGTECLEEETVYPFQEVAEHIFIRMHECTIRTDILQKQNISLTEHCFYVDMQYILYPIPWITTVCLLKENVYQYRLGMERQSVSVKNMQKNREQHRKVLQELVSFYQAREKVGEQKEVLAYLARGIAKMQADEVQIALSLPLGKEAQKELITQEQYLKQNCQAAYQANQKASIWLLRQSKYMLYLIAALLWKLTRR